MFRSAQIQVVRQYLYDVLERRDPSRPFARVIDRGLMALILLNIAAFVLETVHSIGETYHLLFNLVLVGSLAIFATEYLLRLWVCTLDESGLYQRPIKGRLRYMGTLLALVDLAAILPIIIAGLAGMDFRFLRVLRLLWILKITRYFPAVGTLGRVLKRERKTLAAVLAVMVVILFVASSLIYLLEHERQPEAFASIPHAMWWGMATLTTVGYGDVVPVSPMGKMLGVVIMMLGIGTFALPAGILASGFAEERKRQNFILSWNLIAKVPVFSVLSAKDIASIAGLLRARELHANEIVFNKGDDGDSMFFIVSGEVEVELKPQPIRMRRGDFFGEVALIYHRSRTATVVATKRTELLELDARDLHRLLDDKPKLRSRILKEAEKRLDHTPA